MHKTKQKILFLVKNRIDSYGVTLGLANSVDMLARKLSKIGVDNRVVRVVDGNSVDREVTLYKPTICMLEAMWVTPEKLDQLATLHPSVRFICRIHSKIPFLSGEGFIFDWLWKIKEISKTKRNLHVAANDLDCSNDLSKVLQWDVKYLPNYYYPEGFEDKWHKKHKSHTGVINIGVFGALRPLKNVLQSATTSIIFADKIGKKLRFHINSGRVEQGGESNLRNIRALFSGHPKHELIEWPWLTHKEFLILINYMDLSMSLSFSETQNICIADGIFQKVPTVGSTDMDWLPNTYRATPSDTKDILNKMCLAHSFPKTNIWLCSRALKQYNKESLKVWEKFLK